MSRTKQTESAFGFNPFEGLKTLLTEAGTPDAVKEDKAAACDVNSIADDGKDNDRKLFIEAVSGVRPLDVNVHERKPHMVHQHAQIISEEEECLRRMRELVSHGRGFVIAKTQEYVEGTGYNVHSAMADRLHQGDFSVQAHIDLHGFLPADAKAVFDGFMKEALLKGWRTVLIIHGRGLSSPEEPVIKNRVLEWLQSNRWRKWIIAYSSARSCDGGTGATYLLLRQRANARHTRR